MLGREYKKNVNNCHNVIYDSRRDDKSRLKN